MIPATYAPHILSLMRIVFAWLYLTHGLQKMFGLFGGTVAPLASMFGAAAVIEIVAGTLILLGLFTRPAAFIASGQMAAAYFIAHLPKSVWPVENFGEPAVLLCFGFLYIASRGAGPLSVDAVMSTSRRH